MTIISATATEDAADDAAADDAADDAAADALADAVQAAAAHAAAHTGAVFDDWDDWAAAACHAVRLLDAGGHRFLLAWDDDGVAHPFIRDDHGIWHPPTSALFIAAAQSEAVTAIQRHIDASGGLEGAALRAVLRTQRDVAHTRHVAEIAKTMGAAQLRRRDAGRGGGVVECRLDEIDQTPSVLGAPNGVIDLTTGLLLTGEQAAPLLVTTRIPDPFDPTAAHEAVEKLTADRFEDDELGEFVLDSYSYPAHGLPARRIVMAIGPPDSGKSTLATALLSAFGRYAGALDAGAVSPNTRVDGGPMPGVATVMPPKRWAVAEEIKDWAVSPERLKGLSGQTPTSWRTLHQPTRTQIPTATMFLHANKMPGHLGLDDEALMERMAVVPWPALRPGTRDPRMLTAFVGGSPDAVRARQALVALVVRRAAAMPPGVPPSPPLQVQVRTAEATIQDLNAAQRWCDEALAAGDASVDFVSTADLWARAAADHGVDASDAKARIEGIPRSRWTALVAERLDLGATVKARDPRGKTVRGWWGLRLVEDVPPPSANATLDPQPVVDGLQPVCDRCGDYTRMCRCDF